MSTNETKKTSTKSSNYSQEQVNTLLSNMQGVTDHAGQVAAILATSTTTGKTVRSLSAKLSSMSRQADNEITFFKKAATTKTGGKVQSKAQKITQMAGLLDVSESDIESLETGTKVALDIVLDALTAAHDGDNDATE